MNWFDEAHFGVIVHWGLYSLVSGYWNGEKCPTRQTEWLQRSLKVPLKEYQTLQSRFSAPEWDAEKLVRLAKRAGAKYLCFTAKHHDGFSMYDTAVSDYKVTNTPLGRDVLKEIQTACEKEGLVLCVYYSQMQDWAEPDAFGNDWDFDAEKKDFKRYFDQKVCPQVREILENYGRIGTIWFDTPLGMPENLCRKLRDLVKSIQPDCLVNSRIGYDLGDYIVTGDNCIPSHPWKSRWEMPMTLNESWGYNEDDTAWKNARDVIGTLVRTVSLGGNLLVNLGPDGDGNIPEESRKILYRVGDFLKEAGESIYGARPAPDFPYCTPDLFVTQKDQTAYLHFLKPPEDRNFKFYGFITPVLRAAFLKTGDEIRQKHFYDPARDEHRLCLYLPNRLPEEDDLVIRLELEEALRADRSPDEKLIKGRNKK